MPEKYKDLFDLSMEEVMESDYRFRVNRTRSVIIFDGSEFDDDALPDNIDIYTMYNDVNRRPMLISIIDVSGAELDVFEHEEYKLTYISPEKNAVTYLRKDALSLLSEEELSAIDENIRK